MWVKLGRAYNKTAAGRVSKAGSVRVRVKPLGEARSEMRFSIGVDVGNKIGITNGSSVLVSAKTDDAGKFTGRYRITPCAVEERTCKVFQLGPKSRQLVGHVSIPVKMDLPIHGPAWGIAARGVYMTLGETANAPETAVKKRNISPAGRKAMRLNAARMRERKRIMMGVRAAEAAAQ